VPESENKPLHEKIRALPGLEHYRNNRTVATIKGVPLLVEDFMKAALISRSNTFLIAGKGEGKTDLNSDIYYRLFGGRGIFIECDPDLDLKELYACLNLSKLYAKSALTDADIHELRETLNTHIIVVDELNRAPTLTQNRLFALANGVFRHRGKEYPIGDNYSIMLASANVGAKHAGTFEIPDALLDRMSIILSLKQFTPIENDFSLIFEGDHDPRVHRYSSLNGDDGKWDERIVELYSQFKQLKASVEMKIVALYLRLGLDWCDKEKRPKSQLDDLPGNCKGCGELGWGCGYISPISTRWAKNLIRLTLALQQVALSKHPDPENAPKNDVLDMLETYRILTPPTGIFDPQFIRQSYHGNPYLFADVLAQRIIREFFGGKDDRGNPVTGKAELIINAIAEFKKHGGVDSNLLNKFTKEWTFMQNWFKQLSR